MAGEPLQETGGRRRELLGFAGWLALVTLAAMGGVLTPSGAWYAGLEKPPFTPPDLLFPVAWTLLYALMTVSAWLVWRRTGLVAGLPALLPFIAQLGANGLWSILFFQWHRVDLALVDLAALWVLVALTMLRFHRVSATACWLLLPYLAWVSFAVYLNAAILLLNGPAPPG